MGNRDKIYDNLLEMKSASAVVTASAAATVDGTAKIFDTGGGFTRGNVVIDVDATTEALLAADGQVVRIVLQGSNSATFAATAHDHVNLTALELGINGVFTAGAQLTWDAAAGRYVIPFTNLYADTLYRYLRVYHDFSGTWATGIAYTAYLSKD